jgi:hypothetical protein
MAFTIDQALDDEYLTVVSRDDLNGIYRVRVGDLKTVVTIHLRHERDSPRTGFSVTHAIKTPVQADAYRTNLPFGETAGDALHRAVTGITMYNGDTVKAGHQPAEAWLHPW